MLIKKTITTFAMAAVVLLAACNEKEDARIRPSVASTNPVSDASDVLLNHNITAIFSEEMDASTDTKFLLLNGEEEVVGTTAFNDLTLSFNPEADLLPNTIYTAVIDKSASNLAGSSMFDDYSWEFTTGAEIDEIVPTVISTLPEDEATDVALDQAIVFTFSELMDQSTINASSFELKQGETVVTGEITFDANTVILTPYADLDANSSYTVSLTTGAKDLAGNAIAEIKTISFTTIDVDVSIPRVNATNPLDGAEEVEGNVVVSVTFNEEMDVETINNTSFTLKQGENSIDGTVSYNNKIATFTPDALLVGGLVYTAAISTVATDLAGNALAENTVWSFTTLVTDTSTPIINEYYPLDNAIGVERNVTVSVSFNEEMDVETINNSSFTLMQGTNSIAGTVSYTNEVATFNPESLLDAGLTYTATITTDVTDLAGNAFTEDTEWTFTTAETSSNLAVVDLGSSANYVILAKSTITNVPTSAVTGDMGLSPAATSLITGFDLVDATGFATSAQVIGQVFAADMASPTPTNLTVAVEDMMLAYTDAAGRPTPDFLELATGSIGGLTLSSGLYKWTTTVTISDDVVISGGADDVFIFQIAGDLSMSSAKNITLTGGVQAKNIFWQVAGSASIGTNSAFQGIVLSMNDIILQTEASFFGRALAQKAVILDQNAVTKPE